MKKQNILILTNDEVLEALVQFYVTFLEDKTVIRESLLQVDSGKKTVLQNIPVLGRMTLHSRVALYGELCIADQLLENGDVDAIVVQVTENEYQLVASREPQQASG